MTQGLHNLQRPSGNKRSKKRLGRGNGSGKGTYSARGLKGQKARSGGRRGIKRRAAFQQLLIRTPKLKGFNRQSAPVFTVSLSDLDKTYKDGDTVTVASLRKKRLIPQNIRGGSVKVLGNGTIQKKLAVTVHTCSTAAKKAITEAGGSCEITKK